MSTAAKIGIALIGLALVVATAWGIWLGCEWMVRQVVS